MCGGVLVCCRFLFLPAWSPFFFHSSAVVVAVKCGCFPSLFSCNNKSSFVFTTTTIIMHTQHTVWCAGCVCAGLLLVCMRLFLRARVCSSRLLAIASQNTIPGTYTIHPAEFAMWVSLVWFVTTQQQTNYYSLSMMRHRGTDTTTSTAVVVCVMMEDVDG